MSERRARLASPSSSSSVLASSKVDASLLYCGEGVAKDLSCTRMSGASLRSLAGVPSLPALRRLGFDVELEIWRVTVTALGVATRPTIEDLVWRICVPLSGGIAGGGEPARDPDSGLFLPLDLRLMGIPLARIAVCADTGVITAEPRYCEGAILERSVCPEYVEPRKSLGWKKNSPSLGTCGLVLLEAIVDAAGIGGTGGTNSGDDSIERLVTPGIYAI